MAIGQAGSVTTSSPIGNEPIEVELLEPLTDPVIVFTHTNQGADPYTIRLVDQTIDGDGNTTHFSFIIEEWEYLDGPHPAVETINWLAIEEGVHELPDGRVIEAGTTSANTTNTAVSLTGGFTEPPVVLTSVMSENDTITVDSDPLDVTKLGFNVRLQEEEGQDNIHALETVGYIAIQTGGTGDGSTDGGTAQNFINDLTSNSANFDLGEDFQTAIVLAETQTINGGNPGTVIIDGQNNSDVDLLLREEQSGDNEINHIPETVGVVAFENGLIPCLTLGTLILTPKGLVPVEDLKPGDQVQTYDKRFAQLGLSLIRDIPLEVLEEDAWMRPVCIAKGALGHGLPVRDLIVSPQHRMLINSPIAERMFGSAEVLISARKLTGLPGITTAQLTGTVRYIHLVFDRHEIIYAEGAPTETFLPGPEALRTLPKDALRALDQCFPHYLLQPDLTEPARPVPSGKRQRNFVQRLEKNGKWPIDARVKMVA